MNYFKNRIFTFIRIQSILRAKTIKFEYQKTVNILSIVMSQGVQHNLVTRRDSLYYKLFEVNFNGPLNFLGMELNGFEYMYIR